MIIRHNKLWNLAVLAWTGVIFFSSTSIADQWGEQGFNWLLSIFFSHSGPGTSSYAIFHLLAHKSVHVFLFLVLALLLWKSVPDGEWKIALILVFGAFIGSCSEFLQRFFPGRDPAIRDVLINVAATGLGIFACLTVKKLQLQRELRVET